MNTLKRIVPLIVMLGMAGSAFGQVDTKEAQKKLLAKRAAEADAYRKLAECIKGLQIDSQTFVKDFVAESDVIRTEMDTFIRGVRLGDPRWYADLSCEVPAEVTVAKVVTELQAIHKRHYTGDRIKGTDFEQIKKYVEKDIIKAVGMGAPREDLPPDLPEGVAEQLGAPAAPEPVLPDLWLQVGPQARLMAVRAARVDAMRKLVERIIGLRIDSETIVRDFVAESDTINAVARGTLIGASEERIYYHNDEPIVEVTMSVPLESVVSTIKELQARTIQGDRVKGLDVTQVKKQIKTTRFEATGMGIPPEKHLRAVERKVAQISYPDWATAPISMTGMGVPPDDKAGTAQGKLLAARAAELDAKRRLAEHVHGLMINSSTSVQDFVTQHDEISTYMEAMLVNSSVIKTEFDGETARVTVSIPGMQVWETVSQRMRAG